MEDKKKGNAKPVGRVEIRMDECKGCGLCIDQCPTHVLRFSPVFNRMGYHPVEWTGEGCTGCGICFYACPEPGAITVYKARKPALEGAEATKEG